MECLIKNQQYFLLKKVVKIVINNFEQLKDLINISNQINLKAGCAIHIDTGMNRLGVNVRRN